MKKIISFILTFAMVFALLPLSINAVGETLVSLEGANGTDTVNAEAGKALKVYLKIDEAFPVSAAQITVNYDTALELVYVENGKTDMDGTLSQEPYLNTMYNSAVYGVDFEAQNGVYVFNATHNMENGSPNVNKTSGYFATLTFKVPDSAKEGDNFNISVSKENSKLVSVDGKENKDLDFSVSNAKIVVSGSGSTCESHNFTEKVSSTVSYISNGFKYRECSVCHKIEIEKSEAWAINALTYDGVAIRYAGNPTGLAATFSLNMEQITDIESEARYNIEIGTISVLDGKEIKTVYYGEGKTQDIKNDKIFAVLTGIESTDKAKFSAYVTITDTQTGAERTVYSYAGLAGKQEICIYDIVVRMDFRSYPSQESQNYLNTVLNGF